MSERTLEAIEADLTQLDSLASELEAQRQALLTEISQNLSGDTGKLEVKQGGLLARLQAVPLRRRALEEERAMHLQARALAELETMYSQHYEHEELLHKLDKQIERAQATLNKLAEQRASVNREMSALYARISNHNRRSVEAGLYTTADYSQVASRWSWLSPTYPNYRGVMEKRAQRGHLPPGKTLADFGLAEPQEAP